MDEDVIPASTSSQSQTLEHECPLLSVIVPVYNESEVVDTFYERMTTVLSSLDGMDYEVIFVDDGSHDDTYERALARVQSDPHIHVVKLSRNFGHQLAITAGIDSARGDAVVVIDADLQDPPELIREFIEKWKEGYDVVYGVRVAREGEGPFKIWSASIFYRLLRSLVKTEIPADVGDFRLMSKPAASHFRQLREKDRFVRGMVSWLGFKQTGVSYKRAGRHAGVTKYPLRKMLRFALDGIVSFSIVPLQIATWLGYLTSILAFLYLCSVFIQKALGFTVEGWATIMVAVLFMGGVQLICLGIIGEYVGRIFDEVKNRPLYIVEDVDGQKVLAPEARQSYLASIPAPKGNKKLGR